MNGAILTIIRNGGVKFQKKKNLAYFSKTDPWAPKSRSAKFQTNWILVSIIAHAALLSHFNK